jgi:hypothetical protein
MKDTTRERKYSCPKCAEFYTAYPPDDNHTWASANQLTDVSEFTKMEHKCQCGIRNTLYWYREGD